MRTLPVLAVLLLTASATAQEMTFTDPHQIRIGYGDLPSTDAVEADGQWNVEETHSLDAPAVLALPAGAMDALIRAENGTANATLEADGYHVTPEGEQVFTITYSLAGSADVLAAQLDLEPQSRVFLYTGPGAFVHAATDSQAPLAWPGDSSILIHEFTGSLPERFWFNVAPVAPATSVEPTPGIGLDAMSLLLGVVAGALVWALLVSRGVVQRRSRKQVASSAVHKEVAARESKQSLAGRKRMLMAALKELEMAKMNKDIEPAVYDSLKAEFKRETVTVMRAMEEQG